MPSLFSFKNFFLIRPFSFVIQTRKLKICCVFVELREHFKKQFKEEIPGNNVAAMSASSKFSQSKLCIFVLKMVKLLFGSSVVF